MPMESLFEEVKSAYDIVDVVANYVKLKKVGRNYVGLCPFHSEKTPSFVVSPEKQIFKCFGCGVAGDVVTFYMKIKGLSFKEALIELAEQAGIRVDYREFKTRKENKGLVELNYKVAKFYHHLYWVHGESEIARDYVKKRGLSEETVKTFLLGFAPEEGRVLASYLRTDQEALKKAKEAGLLKTLEDGSHLDLFRGRLIFPIFNSRGECVGFGGRALLDGLEPKYLNSPESKVFKKSEVLYGFYQAKDYIKKEGFGILVEGYFDFLTLWDKGIKNVVATCGTALTETHVKMLKKLSDEWTIFYDGDSAGKKATVRAISLFLKEGIKPKCVLLPEGEDPDSWVRKVSAENKDLKGEILSLTKDSVSFVLDFYRDAYEKNPSKAFKEIVEVFKGIEDPILKKEVVKELSFALDLPENEVFKAISSSKKRDFKEDTSFETEKVGSDLEDSSREEGLKLIAQYLLSYPEDYEELKASGIKEFLKLIPESRCQRFLLFLVEKLEEGDSSFETVPDPEFQELLGDLLLSPGFEEKNEVLAQIKSYITKTVLKTKVRRLAESIKDLERRGVREEVEKYVWMLKQSILSSRTIHCKEEHR